MTFLHCLLHKGLPLPRSLGLNSNLDNLIREIGGRPVPDGGTGLSHVNIPVILNQVRKRSLFAEKPRELKRKS